MKITKHKAALLVLLSLVIQNLVSAQKIPFSTEEDLKVDVETVPCKNKKRLEGVKKLFISKGAAESEVEIRDYKVAQNLIVEKKGDTGEIVYVGAHYDEAGGGCGALDNWTGIVIIANLYKTLKPLKTRKTYKFVAFGKEEQGLIGSRAMVKSLSDSDRSGICAMVNFDSFGLAYPQAMGNVSSPKLVDFAETTAKAMKMPFAKAAIRGASSDSAAFMAKKIPAITIHGMNNNWRKYLHSSNDKVKNVKSASVYFGYRFGISLLAGIEAKPCNAFSKKI